MAEYGLLSARAAANQVAATVDAVSEGLLTGRGWLHPVASLTGRADVDARPSLFSPAVRGDERQVLPGTGAVVGWDSATGPHGAPVSAAAVRRILDLLGGGQVLGCEPPLTARELGLPVTAEPAAGGQRPAFPVPAAPAGLPGPLLTPGIPGVRVRLAIPTVFHSLLVPGDSERLAAHLVETAQEVLAGARGTARRHWAAVIAATADLARDAGTVFAGLCRLRVAGRESTATLVTTVSPCTGTGSAAELSAACPHAEVREVALPCGPAVVLVEAGTTPVPAVLAADGRGRLISTAAALALIPLPGGTRVLCIELSTPYPQDWELYGAAFTAVLSSVEVAWDGSTGHRAAPPPVPTGRKPAVPSADHDPFGTVSAVPAPVRTPASPTSPQHETPAGGAKGTPVQVPPADWDPWGSAPASTGGATAAADRTAPTEGTPVQVPPADWDPWA